MEVNASVNPSFHQAIDKAMGASRGKVANLRAARAKAEKAYTFTA